MRMIVSIAGREQSLPVFLFLIFLHVCRNPLLAGIELPFHGALDLIRDGEQQIRPERQTAGGGEKIHTAEERRADIITEQLIDHTAHPGVQLTGDGEHFPVVRDAVSGLSHFVLQLIQLLKGMGELFEKAHIGGVKCRYWRSRSRRASAVSQYSSASGRVLKDDGFSCWHSFKPVMFNCVKTKSMLQSFQAIGICGDECVLES